MLRSLFARGRRDVRTAVPVAAFAAVEQLEGRRLMSVSLSGSPTLYSNSSYAVGQDLTASSSTATLKVQMAYPDATTGAAGTWGDLENIAVSDLDNVSGSSGTLLLYGQPGRTLYYRVSDDAGTNWSSTITVSPPNPKSPASVSAYADQTLDGNTSFDATWDNDPYTWLASQNRNIEKVNIRAYNGSSLQFTVNNLSIDPTDDVTNATIDVTAQGVDAYAGMWSFKAERSSAAFWDATPLPFDSAYSSFSNQVQLKPPSPTNLTEVSDGSGVSEQAPAVTIGAYEDSPFKDTKVQFYYQNGDTIGSPQTPDPVSGYVSISVEGLTPGATYNDIYARALAPNAAGDTLYSSFQSTPIDMTVGHTYYARWNNASTNNDTAYWTTPTDSNSSGKVKVKVKYDGQATTFDGSFTVTSGSGLMQFYHQFSSNTLTESNLSSDTAFRVASGSTANLTGTFNVAIRDANGVLTGDSVDLDWYSSYVP